MYILLISLSFAILFPFIAKFSISLMTTQDLNDPMVRFIPHQFTLDNYIFVYENTSWLLALVQTVVLSLICAGLQVFVSCFIGYGLANFKFRGNKIIFGIILFTMILPPVATRTATYIHFTFFDLYGLIPPLRMVDSMWPMIYLSATGLALKNGLYIFVFRQYFARVPHELSEAAEVDGAGVFRTYFRIILPLASSMMLTVFLLAFAWQWNDSFYSPLFFPKFKVLSNTIFVVSQLGLSGIYAGSQLSSVMINTALIMLIVPLLLLYLFAQRYFIQGIERSGLVG